MSPRSRERWQNMCHSRSLRHTDQAVIPSPPRAGCSTSARRRRRRRPSTSRPGSSPPAGAQLQRACVGVEGFADSHRRAPSRWIPTRKLGRSLLLARCCSIYTFFPLSMIMSPPCSRPKRKRGEREQHPGFKKPSTQLQLQVSNGPKNSTPRHTTKQAIDPHAVEGFPENWFVHSGVGLGVLFMSIAPPILPHPRMQGGRETCDRTERVATGPEACCRAGARANGQGLTQARAGGRHRGIKHLHREAAHQCAGSCELRCCGFPRSFPDGRARF